jgi:Major Facilitator Superfamily
MTSNGHASLADNSRFEQKEDIKHSGHRRLSSTKHGDHALAIIGDDRISLKEEDVCSTVLIYLILGGSIHLSPHDANDKVYTFTDIPQNRHIRRKTDQVILAILVWVYFLQILDKSVLGYAATFGLQTDTHLTGNQYSLVGSIAPIAQLAWQPFSSILIVKVPHRILMPTLVLGWGIAQSSMAACHSYSTLLAARFFLGLFEAGCLPLFSVITSQWYRRSEQPIRVAAWYSTNGWATIAASALSYGLGHIPSSTLESWQM